MHFYANYLHVASSFTLMVPPPQYHLLIHLPYQLTNDHPHTHITVVLINLTEENKMWYK